MTIYDCFSFFDELDLLEIRFNILNDYVDKFVLMEAPETFFGKPKPLIFKNNKERFKQWEHKIIYHVIDDFPNDKNLYEAAVKSPNTGLGPNKDIWWIREFYQKESLNRVLLNCNDDDIIYVSDVDEIWNPNINIKFDSVNVFKPVQTNYPFYLNHRSNQDPHAWTGTRVSKYKVYKKYGANHFRTEREAPSIKILNGGWHFSWLSKKVDKYEDGHPDQINRFNTVQNVHMWKDESALPEYILKNKNKLVTKNLMLP